MNDSEIYDFLAKNGGSIRKGRLKYPSVNSDVQIVIDGRGSAPQLWYNARSGPISDRSLSEMNQYQLLLDGLRANVMSDITMSVQTPSNRVILTAIPPEVLYAILVGEVSVCVKLSPSPDASETLVDICLSTGVIATTATISEFKP